MHRTLLTASLLALLFGVGAAHAQHGTLGPADGSKQFVAARGILSAAAEISVPIEGSSTYLAAKQLRVEVGFPRYRVLLWNSGRTAVTATVSVWRAKGQ